MKKIIASIILILIVSHISAQIIHTKTYGDSKNKVLIFLHGGPGYNAVAFEVTTAQKLAENGFYVIVYDRRGEGRSVDSSAKFTFQQTFDDLNAIYNKFNLTKAHLLGHSFGGIIATLFAEKYSEKVASILLIGAPVNLQESFLTILKTSKQIYETKKDSVNLNYIGMIEKMDKKSLSYSSYTFAHAMQNGFYSPKKPSKDALTIYSKFRTDSLLIKYSSQMSFVAPQGFWKNENYTSINLSSNIIAIQRQKIKIYGLYGKEDGLYSKEQISQLETLIGKNNLNYLENCSHNVFIDQQDLFINSLKKWLN
jgi:proline iminopeptidase